MSEPNAPEHLRLFIAVPLPQPVKDEIADAQSELRRVLPQITLRWTRREQFHLTLRFLGNVEAQCLEALTQAVNAACQNFAPLRLRAEQVGFFPNARYPRVLWIGVRDTQNQLLPLQRAVQAATGHLTTEAPEERFSGHVTLARINRLRRSEAATLSSAAAAMAERLFGQWTAESIELMRSQLSPQQATHTTLAIIPLGGQSRN
jgi:RNA 2',3'-cyclic 3'-phosphodiesterase